MDFYEAFRIALKLLSQTDRVFVKLCSHYNIQTLRSDNYLTVYGHLCELVHFGEKQGKTSN